MTDRNIEVAVRLRPPLPGEVTVSHENLHLLVEENSVVVKTLKHTFDHVFNEESSNYVIYQKIVAPHIKNLLSGFNVTVLAYGSTGSGKSFSMGISAKNIEKDQGIIPLSIKDIFNSVQNLTDKNDVHLSVSFFEIYLEDIKDLLNPSNSANLMIRGEAQEVKVSNLSEVTVNSYYEALQLLEKGSSTRHTDLTAKNVMSSRSHAIFMLNIILIDKSSGHTTRSKFQLVDLAGSERTKTSKTEGQQFKQGLAINKALSTLGRVINSIFKKQSHVPYRDSSLTRILQDSFGGNSYTVMIACISPALSSLEESHSTIRYAHQATSIKNNPVVNKDPKEELIEKLQSELQKCKQELEKYRKAEDRCQKETKDNSFKTTSEKDLAEVFENIDPYDVTINNPTRTINISVSQSSLELHQEPRQKEEEESLKNIIIEQPAETALKKLNLLNENLEKKEKELQNYYSISKIIDVSQPIEASDVHKLIVEKIQEMEEERKVLIEKYDETHVKIKNELEEKIIICQEELKNKDRACIFKMSSSKREEFLKNEIKNLKSSKLELIKKYKQDFRTIKKKETETSKRIAAQEKKFRIEEGRWKKREISLKNKISIFEKKLNDFQAVQVKSSLNKKASKHTKKDLSKNILNQINIIIQNEISTEKLKSDIMSYEEELKNLKEQAEIDGEKNESIETLSLNITKMKKTLKDSLNEEIEFEFVSNLDEAKSALNILLYQIKTSEKEKNDLHRRLEESNSSLESSAESLEKLFKENLTLTKENNDLKSKQASSPPPIKKRKKKESPSQNVIDPSEIVVYLENPDESFESTSDINDPDYRATPLNKRKLKRKIIPETVLLEEETPVKKMVHGCSCPSNCTTLRCACRKKSHICGSYCTCDSKICLNVPASSKN